MTAFVLGLSVMAGIVAGVSLFGVLWLRRAAPGRGESQKSSALVCRGPGGFYFLNSKTYQFQNITWGRCPEKGARRREPLRLPPESAIIQ